MIPSALVQQLRQGLADFLRASFRSTTPGFEDAIDRLLAAPGAVTRGPYVQVFLPFVRGGRPDFFPDVPLPYVPYRHQAQAFARLGGEQRRNTLIATGTGSGKTESFLWPILDYCRQQAGQPGVKAILVYPMNALATDQALRLAKAIHLNPELRGAVTAGLYVGEDAGDGGATHEVMGPEHLITDREVLRAHPPDILLTNYRMLDYLLIRPQDRPLWESSGSALRYLVVDELHTFDGAQGTDLACLIRRLKDRLGLGPGDLCCVGTSATLGGDDEGTALVDYARRVFGEPFDRDAVIREAREDLGAFRGDRVIRFWSMPQPADHALLDPGTGTDPNTWTAAQARLWFGEEVPGEPGTIEWRVKLGEWLQQHVMLDNLLRKLRGVPRDLPDVVADLGQASPAFEADPAFGVAAVLSFLGLVSEARRLQPELEPARLERAGRGEPPPQEPFLQVRIQLWQREMRRMVADLAPTPQLRFLDDLTEAQRQRHLPVVHCRECGAMGWGALVPRDNRALYRTDARSFYRAFFADDSRIHFLFPAAATPARPLQPRRLDCSSLIAGAAGDPPQDGTCDVLVAHPVDDRGRLSRDCPFCETPHGLSLIGFQAATLTSVHIDQLFASAYNDDKKLLTFSDSVQDAAHRAGFFGARTWRFNLRIALEKYLEAEGAGRTLADAADGFASWWRGSGGLDEPAFIATFIAPNMLWLRDWEELQELGSLAGASDLPRLIAQRLRWEIQAEFGLNARIGRSLPRTGVAVAAPDATLLEQAAAALLEPLRNEIGGLDHLRQGDVLRFLRGLLTHLLERGGLLMHGLPAPFVESGGRDTHAFSRVPWLPDYGPGSRLPGLLADQQTARFDRIVPPAPQGWYARWYHRTLAAGVPLTSGPDAAYPLVLRALVAAGILEEREGTRHGKVWGLRPEALRLDLDVVRARCDRCGHASSVPARDCETWLGMPCLSGRCEGHMAAAAAAPEYFASLYRAGEVARIFAEEHTGLLTRAHREEIESRFKAGKNRMPWDPNLLSCTPTLEMGIDVGDLSSAILCSVPPAQANYLQRIGRAGRRDGNSLVLTVANARSHDLYFYEAPEEMIAGAIDPPDVHLNASAVLERQLTAYCFDRWVASGVEVSALPWQMKEVHGNLRKGQDRSRFPYNLTAFVESHRDALLDGFLALFRGELQEETQAHLHKVLRSEEDGGLMWRMLDAMQTDLKLMHGHEQRRSRLNKLITAKKQQTVRDHNYEDDLAVLEQERSALRALIEQLRSRQTLEFLTDQGLLPNYAFPEAPVRLLSVIWRQLKESDSEGRRYESWSYDYGRPGSAAIAELAPNSSFYASGRRVRIDQVDLAGADIEQWRFCDECSFSRHVQADEPDSCPSCGSREWPDKGRVHHLLRLRQVFANTHDAKSRIRDDRDDREPRYFARQLLVTFADADRGPAWRVDDATVPFAFEYLARANFREVNFGEQVEDGAPSRIAGEDLVRRGFTLCRHCGKIQSRDGDGVHAITCIAATNNRREEFETCVHLYRQFDSEAVRLLLPIADLGSERQRRSLEAALHLGLRQHFGGRVDHLRTTLASEPVPGTILRKLFLVLFDTVPGGTGYLKELTREPDTLFAVLRKARDRLAACRCANDPARDGCYRCLLAYRNSYDMADTSRAAALELLNRILARSDHVKPVTSLSDVDVDGLMDSVLEARFLDALGGLGREHRPSVVTKAIVKGKPGYRWRIGERVWQVEPQVHVPASGPTGVGIDVSVDFVLHPGLPPEGQAEVLPVAVFLDGWEHHRDRIALDMLQRAALRQSGRWDVWSFTWHDVAPDKNGAAQDVPNLIFHDADALQKVAGHLRGLLSRVHDLPMAWFADTMAGEVTRADWVRLAYLVSFSQMAVLDAGSTAQWKEAVHDLVPSALVDDLLSVGEAGGPGLLRQARAHRPVALLAATTAQAAREDFQAIAAGADPKGLRIVACLDDSPDEDEGTLHQAWKGFLRLSIFLRHLSGLGLFTRWKQEEHEWTILRPGIAGAVIDGAWAGVQAEMLESYRGLALVLSAAGCPLPTAVGLDLTDHRGRTTGVLAELAWSGPKVAVVLRATLEHDGMADTAWTLFVAEDVLEDTSALLAALNQNHPDEDVSV